MRITPKKPPPAPAFSVRVVDIHAEPEPVGERMYGRERCAWVTKADGQVVGIGKRADCEALAAELSKQSVISVLGVCIIAAMADLLCESCSHQKRAHTVASNGGSRCNARGFTSRGTCGCSSFLAPRGAEEAIRERFKL